MINVDCDYSWQLSVRKIEDASLIVVSHNLKKVYGQHSLDCFVANANRVRMNI